MVNWVWTLILALAAGAAGNRRPPSARDAGRERLRGTAGHVHGPTWRSTWGIQRRGKCAESARVPGEDDEQYWDAGKAELTRKGEGARTRSRSGEGKRSRGRQFATATPSPGPHGPAILHRCGGGNGRRRSKCAPSLAATTAAPSVLLNLLVRCFRLSIADSHGVISSVWITSLDFGACSPANGAIFVQKFERNPL